MKFGTLDWIVITATIVAILSFVGSVLLFGLAIYQLMTYRQNPPSPYLATFGGYLKEDCGGVKIVKDYLPFIKGASQKYGVDQATIAAVIMQESSWDPKAGSSVGAQGLMQLMPGTYGGIRNGSNPVYNQNHQLISSLTNVDGVGLKDNITDPETNIYFGAHYLAFNIAQRHGNLAEVFASYNAGPGAVDEFGGIPPWEETINYVKSLLGIKPAYAGGYVAAYKKCLDKTETTGVDSSGLHPNIQKIIAQVEANPGKYQQPPNSCECSDYNDNLMRDTFGESVFSGFKTLGQRDGMPRSAPPSQQDLQQARDLLAQGKLVKWHINGDASGQHWILLTKIEGTTISFFDPGGGKIYTEPYDAASKNPSLGKFFGITPDNPNGYTRGFEFTPK